MLDTLQGEGIPSCPPPHLSSPVWITKLHVALIVLSVSLYHFLVSLSQTFVEAAHTAISRIARHCRSRLVSHHHRAAWPATNDFHLAGCVETGLLHAWYACGLCLSRRQLYIYIYIHTFVYIIFTLVSSDTQSAVSSFQPLVLNCRLKVVQTL